jgi:hypothetical protein
MDEENKTPVTAVVNSVSVITENNEPEEAVETEEE